MNCSSNVSSFIVVRRVCGPHFAAGLKRAEDASTVEEIRKLYIISHTRCLICIDMSILKRVEDATTVDEIKMLYTNQYGKK